jgi:hypothetical protein
MTEPGLTAALTQPAQLPGEWTFWADQADARLVPPHAPLGPVQVTGYSCGMALSGFGKGSIIVPVEGNALSRYDLLRFYGWRLWAFYDGALVWGGLPTGLHDDGGSAVELSLTELPGYLERKQYAMNQVYEQIEQTVIARDLAARLENISVPVITEPGPGFLRDRSYTYLESGSRGELLTNLCEVIEGPQFRAEYDMLGGRPRCRLRIAYPRVGRDSGLGLVVPAGAVQFSLAWDSEQLRTRTFAVGELEDDADEDAVRPVETVFRPQPGIPNVDAADDWPGVTLRETLRERAETNATIYATPTLQLEATVPVNDPPLGSYGVGDDVLVTITDAMMPSGLQLTAQLTAMEVNAAEGTVGWTVATTQPPPKPANLLTARLDAATSLARGMFHRRLQDPPEGIDET